MKKIIITGVTGQDGSLMADFLLKNTEDTIIGGVRRLSVKNHDNINHLKPNPRFKLIDLDVTDHSNTNEVILKESPDYFINFAANSFVGNSWSMPVNHMETNAMAVLYQLNAISKYSPKCRYYNAGSSEEFGDVITCPQNEMHPLRPRSPYGASKASARHLVKVYRDSYDLYAVQGWLFNHEGIRRGEDFVTRKISKGVARITKEIENNKKIKPISIGNIEAKRDWSDAEDFVEGIWLMLNNKLGPKDYVLSSGKSYSIRQFIEAAFSEANIPCFWSGSGLSEKLILANHISEENNTQSQELLNINEKFYRPAEVDILMGDPSLAEKELNWTRKTDFRGLVNKMYKNDYSLLSDNLK
jgi:GDPmannose 4,6-dehydratase